MIKVYLEYKTQINNFLYLTIVYGINIFLPLALFPFLLHKLGESLYGKIIFTQTIANYFLVFTNFGFNISSTKSISLNKDNQEKINIIFSSTIYTKLILFFISLLINLLFCIISGISKNDIILYIASLFICFSDALLPIWFFQGIEKIKYITIVNVLSRILGAIFILLIVRNENDYIFIPLLYFTGNLFGSIISLYIAIKKENIRFIFVEKKNIIERIKEGYVFLFSDFSSIIKDKGNISIIGVFLGISYVVYYDLAEKIIWAFRSILYNMNIVFFPYIVKNNNKERVKKIIWAIFSCGCFLYAILYFFSDTIIYFISRDESMLFINSFIHLMGVYLLLATFSSCIGQFILIVNNLEKLYLKSLLITSISYFSLILFLYIMKIFSIESLIIAYNASILIELIYRVYICKKKNLIGYII
ncbi:oligosaccharide flippase family protein [Avibacterium sp. 20-15]|uniref:oligosaccharide flippase family protein n=1 Tax=unclassified Avibacterium TaxID=2685287 RepID=UPI002026977D|nr:MULTISPECIES: oligosaccharide flippase family protein [unclassified Avibacterium]MCW9732199.1 oligosaccharide flippase family protein [Avibacterium sp. 20-15]URL04370.1 oligosaccharide flippase family protein [Avibacterium sp. 20-132]